MKGTKKKEKGKEKNWRKGGRDATKLEDGQRLVWTVSRKYVRIAYTVNKQEKIDRGEHLLNIRAAMTGVEDISRPGRLINYARHKRTTITGRHVRATSPLSHRSYNNHTLFVRLHADARVRPRALKKIERASWDQTTPCTRRDGDVISVKIFRRDFIEDRSWLFFSLFFFLIGKAIFLIIREKGFEVWESLKRLKGVEYFCEKGRGREWWDNCNLRLEWFGGKNWRKVKGNWKKELKSDLGVGLETVLRRTVSERRSWSIFEKFEKRKEKVRQVVISVEGEGIGGVGRKFEQLVEEILKRLVNSNYCRNIEISWNRRIIDAT